MALQTGPPGPNLRAGDPGVVREHVVTHSLLIWRPRTGTLGLAIQSRSTGSVCGEKFQLE